MNDNDSPVAKRLKRWYHTDSETWARAKENIGQLSSSLLKVY